MTELPYLVRQKIVISGEYVEVYNYSNPYWVGFPREWRPKSRYSSLIKQSQEKLRDDNVKRTKKRLKRLVNCNADLNKFLTLTFADEITDFKIANRLFKNFIKRLNYKYPKFKYLVVPEFQDRNRPGVIHYHLLCNIQYLSVPELDGLRELWGQGWIDLRRVYNQGNLGAYMAKYLSKASFDKRYFGIKKFFYSINLLTPVILQIKEDVLDFLRFLKFWTIKTLLWKTTFDTHWLGTVQYEIYRL